MGLSARSAYPHGIAGLIKPSPSSCLPARLVLSMPPASVGFNGHLSPRVLCSEGVILSPSSLLIRPNPPVSTTPADFPVWLVIRQVFARRSGLGCPRDLPHFGSTLHPYVPSSLRREEKW